jgi:signal peptidase I
MKSDKAGKHAKTPDEKAPEEKTKPLWRDVLEVLLSLAVILVVLRLLLGANMPVPLVAVVSCSMLHEDDVIGSVSYGFARATGPLFAEGICVYDAGKTWKEWIKQRVPDADIEGFPLKSGFSVGDMILVTTPDGNGTIFPFFSRTRVGDVVIFNRDEKSRGGEPIIHRVIGIVKVQKGQVAGVEGTLDCFTEHEFESRFIPYVTSCRQGGPCPYKTVPSGDDYEFYLTKGDNNRGSDQCNGILPIPSSQVIARGWIRIPYIGWLKLFLNRIMGLFLGIVSLPLGAFA